MMLTVFSVLDTTVPSAVPNSEYKRTPLQKGGAPSAPLVGVSYLPVPMIYYIKGEQLREQLEMEMSRTNVPL